MKTKFIMLVVTLVMLIGYLLSPSSVTQSNINTTLVDPLLYVSPDILDFDKTINSLPLYIKNNGDGTLQWTVSQQTNLADLQVERAYLVKPDGDYNPGNDVEITSPTAGDSIRLICKVNNLGNLCAYDWKAHVYMDDTLLADTTLSIYARDSIWIWLDYWIAAPGSHKLEWKVDADNIITELNETNNSASYTFNVKNEGLLADLQVERAYLVEPDTNYNPGDDVEIINPLAGEEIRLICRVNNLGNLDAYNWEAQAYMDGTSLLDTTLSMVFAGSSRWIWVPQPWIATVGSHKLEWKVDPDNELPELNETNNSASCNFTVPIFANNNLNNDAIKYARITGCYKDEVVQVFGIDYYLEMNETPNVNGSKSLDKAWLSFSPSSGTNDGTVNVKVDRSKLRGTSDTATLYVYSNGGIKAVIVKVEKEPPILSVNPDTLDFDTLTTSLPLYIKNTGGSTLQWTVSQQMILADLQVERAYLRKWDGDEITNPAVGDSIRLMCIINNLGTADANNWKVEVFMDGSSLGSDTYSLKAGGTYNWFYYFRPWIATPGSHILEWKVDTENVIPELDETNNSASCNFTVSTLAKNNLNNEAIKYATISGHDKDEAVQVFGIDYYLEMNETSNVNNSNSLDKAWLSFSPSSGANDGTVTDTVTVKVDRSKLSGASDMATLYVYSLLEEYKTVTVKVEKNVTTVDPALNRKPKSFALHNNYPNPFNPQTTIEYQLPHPAKVELTIFDLQGNEVRRLINGTKSAGYHTVMWDARDGTGRLVTSGVYFYRIDIKPKDIGQGSFMDVKKMILLK